MIRREKLRITITCDGCGLVREDQDGSRAKWRPYPAVWKEAQDAGWIARKKPAAHDFDHFCPGCQPATSQSSPAP